jgi:hypothetical protein
LGRNKIVCLLGNWGKKMLEPFLPGIIHARTPFHRSCPVAAGRVVLGGKEEARFFPPTACVCVPISPLAWGEQHSCGPWPSPVSLLLLLLG